MQLQKIPRGLLELLRLRSLGEMPHEFRPEIVPVVDATDYYGANQLITTGSAPTVGALANLSETFDITGLIRGRGISAELTIGAAGQTNVSLYVGVEYPAGAAGRCILAQAFFPLTVAGQRIGCGVPLPGLMFTPGTRIVAVATATAGGGVDHSLAVVLLGENLTGSSD